jgi:AraC-like DNA-binding protein
MSLFTFLRGLLPTQNLKTPALSKLFEYYFFDHKYYLHQHSTTENFANLLNISVEEVDYISTSYHGVNFTALIDQHRYQFLIKELDNPINSNLSIQSVIKLCGFENIQSFYHSIKSKNSLTGGIKEENNQSESIINAVEAMKKQIEEQQKESS